MTKAIQIKLLLGLLTVLGIIAGVLARGGRPAYVLTQKDQQVQGKIAQKTVPSAKRYFVP